MLRLLALGLVAFSAALSVRAGPRPSAPLWSPSWTAHTWNEYLDAEGIFPAHLDALPIAKPATSLDADYESLQAHLNNLLNEPEVLNSIYGNYLDHFNKTGDSGRAQIFKATLLDIARHNAATAQGKMSWTKGINIFSDMTFQEFKGRFIGNADESKYVFSNGTSKSSPFQKPAASADWRTSGCVTGVKYQKCQDCFIFGALAIAETHYCVRTGSLIDFSVQHILDCCPHKTCWFDWPSGCANPGFSDGALNFAKGGVIRESDYPYEGKDGSCRAAGKSLINAVGSFEEYWTGGPPNEGLLLEQLARNPVAATIHPSAGFQQYKKGVYDRDVFTGDCDNDQGGHIITVVGYSDDYWIIKNSWSAYWGLEGYMYLKKGENKCGVGRKLYYLTD